MMSSCLSIFRHCSSLLSTSMVVVTLTLVALPTAQGETRLRNICRLKGQEENVLRGLGLVVGLNGTGAVNDGPTMRAIARSMELLGSPVGTNGVLDDGAINELKNIKNAALVVVTASVPGTGARRGEKLNCTVSALNGKSLVGGQLAFAALQGPNPNDRRVFALGSGPVHVENVEQPTVGQVSNGCQMEQDVFTPFWINRGGGTYVTLVLDKNHASFHTAADITRQIRDAYGENYYDAVVPAGDDQIGSQGYVYARDATNIEVRIPQAYLADPVAFAAELLETVITEEDPEARVVVNTRTNTIAISGDVRIGDVVVATNNLIVETGSGVGFTALVETESANPSLDRLVAQLGQLKVSKREVIEIIREIDRAGKLHGKLIVR